MFHLSDTNSSHQIAFCEIFDNEADTSKIRFLDLYREKNRQLPPTN